MVRWLIVLAVGCGYAPDSFRSVRHEFPGVRQTVGCLDIAVLGQRSVITRNPLLEVNLGNRCDHGIEVDLAAIQVRGRSSGQTEEVALVAIDPRREIRAKRLDGRMIGREVIEYRGRGGEVFEALCFDASRVERSARRSEQWTCATLDGAR